jgi:hypothetical protein
MTDQVAEGVEEEIFVGVTPGVGKCTKRFVTSVETAVKFLLDRAVISQYIAAIALKGKMVEVQEGQVEEVQKGQVLKKEIIQINSYWRLSTL